MKFKNNQVVDERAQKKKASAVGSVFLFVFVFIAILVTFFVVQFDFRYDVYKVSGASMQPTLNMYGADKEDIVYACKNAMPKHGEIGVFKDENIKDQKGNVLNLIKRVIATGGDEVDIIKVVEDVEGENGKVTRQTDYKITLKKRNTQETIILEEDYVSDGMSNLKKYQQLLSYKIAHNLPVDKPLLLKDDEYFVLGDNRDNSTDSAYYGPFTICLGRIDFILHYDPIKGTAENMWKSFWFKFQLKF